jgi:peptide/nickel transport system ATP-binding protein
MTGPLLEVDDVSRHFRLRQGLFQRATTLTAVDRVSMTVEHGKSLGVVGESGSGKSTLARLIMALDRPDGGVIRLNGEDLNTLPARELRHRRRQFQMVFQDPRGSLDPRMTIERIVAEPLDVAEPGLGSARRERITAALEAVGLDDAALGRYPHEFSGGQRQRIAIARALVTAPALVVADEPVSALDVSVQAQVLNLMMDLQEARGLAYVFISHDLAVVEHVADDVIVMYRGRIVEQGPAAALFHAPAHPYTRALVDAVSHVDFDTPKRAVIARQPVIDDTLYLGCAYASTCPYVEAACREKPPALASVAPERRAACIKPLI